MAVELFIGARCNGDDVSLDVRSRVVLWGTLRDLLAVKFLGSFAENQ